MRWLRTSRLLMLAATILLIALVAMAGSFLFMRSKLNDEIARIRAKGEPTSWKELADVNVPAEQAAAWNELMAVGKAIEEDPELKPGGKYEFHWELTEKEATRPNTQGESRAEAFLRDRKDLLARVRQALEKNPRPPIDPVTSRPVSEDFAVRPSRLLTLLAVEAAVAAQANDAERWTRTIDQLIDLAMATGETPFGEAQRFFIAYCHAVAANVKHGIKEITADAQGLRLLQDRLRALDTRPALRRMYISDRAYLIGGATRGALGDPALVSFNDRLLTRWNEGKAMAQDVPLLSACIEACDNDWPELFEKIRPLSVASAANWGDASEDSHILGVANAAAQAQAHLRLAEAAIAIRRFQLARGVKPKSLEELVPDYLESVPLDPFDGRAIRYLPSAGPNYFTIYSVGADQRDDGGDGREGDVKPDLFMTVRPVPTMKDQSPASARPKTP